MEDFELAGLVGEKLFRDLLDRIKLPYLLIDQAPETFAEKFHRAAKRPDLLIPFGEARLAAIDIKSKRPGFWVGPKTACVGINKADIKKLAEFERIVGIPVFLAFFDGWNLEYPDLWRITKLLEIKLLREFKDYVLIDINTLPLVSSRDALLQKLNRGASR